MTKASNASGNAVLAKARALYGRRLRAGLLAVRPVRCPQLRLRLTGHGGCRIYSISAVYERGSDLP